MKLDQRNLSEPIDLNEETDLRGSFGKVVKRTLHMEVSVCKLCISAFSTPGEKPDILKTFCML